MAVQRKKYSEEENSTMTIYKFCWQRGGVKEGVGGEWDGGAEARGCNTEKCQSPPPRSAPKAHCRGSAAGASSVEKGWSGVGEWA